MWEQLTPGCGNNLPRDMGTTSPGCGKILFIIIIYKQICLTPGCGYNFPRDVETTFLLSLFINRYALPRDVETTYL